MFLVDYILMNTDRHMKNFGVIRNVNTLKWERTAPIFDTGQSMQCDRIVANMNFVTGTGKFFSNTNKKYDDILKTVLPDVGKIDVSLLDGLADVYEKLLKEYQNKTEMSDNRIAALYQGLKYRINKLKQLVS